jgi:uroporphyrinogen decarboxylase
MRQAGRTLPEYRAVREKHSFWEVCRTPELAAEVTLQPVRRFGLDVAVIFSDILVIPEAMGLQVAFSPRLYVAPPIASSADVRALRRPDVGRALGYVADAIRTVRREAGDGLAIAGFCGAPFTLASYMVEGGSSKHFDRLKSLMYREPAVFSELMERLSDCLVDYLIMQKEAGATTLQLFDTWATILSPGDFRRYALPYLQRIVERVRPIGLPLIYYVNGIGNLLEAAQEIGADILGIDWRVELAEVRRRLGPGRVVQGNLDPGVLFAPPEEIRRRVRAMLEQTGGIGHVVNLGHGLIPSTPLEGIEAFIAAVREWAEERR